MASSKQPTSFPPQSQSQQPGKEFLMYPSPDIVMDEYKPSHQLEDFVTIITGGDSGIGRAVAVLFAKEGSDIVIPYLREHKDAQDTAKLIEKEGRRCLLVAGDLGEEEFCKRIIDKTLTEFDKIDCLINNAAEQHPQEDFTNISSKQLIQTFKTNIFSYFYLTRFALPHLKEGSTIINTTSVTAYRGSKHLIDYSATKGAIVSFTRSLAQNLAPQKIRVNAVAPGPIWTPLIPASFDPDHVASFGSDVPLGRAGQPSEVAPSFVFLASRMSVYMTGQVLHPNGGEIING